MSVETVRAYFRERGMEDRVKELEQSSATVELAARAIGCEPGMIAKTLAFKLKDGPVLVLAAGDARVDNKKFKNAFHEKGRMIPREEVEELTGHAPGGVCPFGVKPDVRVFLDESLKKYDVVYPAAGSDHSMVRLELGELETVSNALGWVDVSKDGE